MKKLFVALFSVLMLFLTSAVMACENCDCGCKDGQKCTCKKECLKDCDCGCHKGEKCTCDNCKCICHKKFHLFKKCKCASKCTCGCHKGEKCNIKDCACGCHEGKECVCEKCNCSDDCKCKSKKSLKNIFRRNKIKCNCEK